ncbi:MAG: 3-oxoacyl-[acyl-carrier-protein] synthase 2 [Pseudomonadota bacterium]
MKRRVVITGVGAVSPLGGDRETSWANVCAGRSGAGPITHFDASTWPVRFACEVKDFSFPVDACAPGHEKYLNRPSEFGLVAALEAMRDSGLLQGESLDCSPGDFGISVGVGIGAVSPKELATMLRSLTDSGNFADLGRVVQEQTESRIFLRNHPGTLAYLLASRWNARGPVTTVHTACASSGQSIGQALLQIQRGEADVILAGGADSLAGELLLAGFCLLGALSRRNDDPQRASRPFDQDRDGFVASEGAAMLVLEERERALARGARIYAELAGFGETESAFRITDLPPDGRGTVEAMQEAVAMAGLTPDDVGYINAHGTSTELNDRIECLAIQRVFGEQRRDLCVSSTKSSTGHLISASGALELMFCVLALRDQMVPPTINLENPIPGYGFDFVPGKARPARIGAALSNSIGFGGSNSALLVTTHPGARPAGGIS